MKGEKIGVFLFGRQEKFIKGGKGDEKSQKMSAQSMMNTKLLTNFDMYYKLRRQ